MKNTAIGCMRSSQEPSNVSSVAHHRRRSRKSRSHSARALLSKIGALQCGEKVQALLWEVRDTESGGAEVILSRSHPEFVAQLFSQEVPELEDGTVAIEKIVRDAGYRTKIAVRSFDPKVDPVGACVGVRGKRVKNIIRELNNEKIDVIPYSEDPVQFLQNALHPIEIKKIKSAKTIPRSPSLSMMKTIPRFSAKEG